MTDETEQFKSLRGTAVKRRQKGWVEQALDAYQAWNSLSENWDIPDDILIPIGISMEKKELQQELDTAFHCAQALVRDIVLVGDESCASRSLDTFVTSLHAAFSDAEQSPDSGLFLSALLSRSGPGVYPFQDLSNLRFVGYGLKNTCIVAEQIGPYAGAFSDHLLLQDTIPKKVRQDALVLALQRPPEKIPDTRPYALGVFASDVTIGKGVYGVDTANGAGNVHILGGTFFGIVAENARYVEVHNGFFYQDVGRFANVGRYYGGVYNHPIFCMTDGEAVEGCNKWIHGRVLDITQPGSSQQWKIVPKKTTRGKRS